MKPKEIAFAIYAVRDIQKSRAFYEQVLGLTPGSVWINEETGMGMIEYELGADKSHTLAIGSGVEHFTPGKSGGVVALEVADFDEAVSMLKKANVQFQMDPMDTPVCKMVAFLDPDGNQLMIHMRK